jgi:two-component system response regulator VicR
MPQKILLINDKPFMVRLIQHHLEKAGYQLIKARNNTEAIEAMAHDTPQLVVVDDRTREPESGSAYKEIAKSTQEIPVIRMTDTPPALAAPGDESKSAVILTKPFSPTQLVAEIKRLIPETKCA